MKKQVKNSFSGAAYTNGYEFSQGSGYRLPQYEAVIPDAVKTGQIEQHQIIIVGGGLSGLTLACCLAQLQIPCVLLDEDNSVGVKGASSRGICYTQKSLEIFDKLGIYERIAAKGIAWSVGRTFAGEEEVFSFDLKQQGNNSLSAQPPFINIQQFYNEGFLVERIAELGFAKIRWNNRVTELSEDDRIAMIKVATPAGSYYAKAQYIIDCTGSRSPFHDWLGIEKTITKGDDRWCIADVRFKVAQPLERHTWIEAPFNENRAVWQHKMADEVWRIDYQMAPDADPAYVSREDVVKERLAKQFGKDVDVEIVWVGPYAYRSECVHRMISHFRKSMVFQMGDTAKVVSPFGARGGNTGIADADNLAWKLAAVLRGAAQPALLQSYDQERLEAAQTNVQVTNRTARFLRPADGMERQFRQAAIALAKRDVSARSLINTGRMAVANSYSRSALASKEMPVIESVANVRLAWTAKSSVQQACLNDLLRWANGQALLLVFGSISPQDIKRLRAMHQSQRVLTVQVLDANTHPQVREHVFDLQSHLRQATQCTENDWALLRPDAYLSARGVMLSTWSSQVLAAAKRLAGNP